MCKGMLAVVALVAIIAVYLLHSKFTAQARQLVDLKRDFNKILQLVEPVVAAPQPQMEEEEEELAEEPQQGPAPPPRAKPYGYRPERTDQAANDPRKGPPPMQAPAMDVPPPASGGGVSLENLSGGNSYAALF